MKHLTCLLAVLFVLALALPAGAGKYYAGPIGGLNIADGDVTDAEGCDRVTSSRTVFGVGGIFGLVLSETVSLELEPKYLQKGTTTMAHNGQPNMDWKFAFIEVPFLAKISFGQQIKPYVKAGPTFGFLLSAEAEAEGGGVVQGSPLTTYTADIKDATKSFELGGAIGAGFTIPLENMTLFVDGRYGMGFGDILDGGDIEWKGGGEVIEGSIYEEAELKTKGFQVMAGAVFPFGTPK
jgi:hypothetical protein